MVTSASRLSYTDCFDLFDKALEDDRGVRFKVSDYGEAKHIQTRLHTARVIDRKDNAATYESTHQLFGRSAYDALAVRIVFVKEEVWIHIEKRTISVYNVESLSEEKVDE